MCIYNAGIYFFLILLIILPVLYEFNNKIKFYVKFLIYFFSVMFSSLFCVPFIIWWPGNVQNTLIAIFPLHVLNMALGLNWNVKGMEHMVVDRPAIVVANHQSSIDFLGMVYMWPFFRKISAIAKNDLFYIMPFGFTAWLCGTRFINRSNPLKARDSMNSALDYCKENKVKLWIFPEGTRNMKEEMLSFKKGAFHLAITGQLPILPVVYSSYSGFLNHPERVWNSGNVIVTCLPPIETTGLQLDDMQSLMDSVRSKMMDTYKQASKEITHPFPRVDQVLDKDDSSYNVH